MSDAFTEEISAFDIFHHLMYMSATAAAGISRSRLFDLARRLPVSTAKYFKEIFDLAEHLRYNYPDACRIVGERIGAEHMRTFLFRFSDALRSGEPLHSFLAREAQVQGENYANEYERRLDSLNKWNDGYTAVTVSVALIVIINIVSTLIYNVGPATIVVMVLTAVSAGFGVAYVLSRAAPQEVKHGVLVEGRVEQRRSLRLFQFLAPTALVTSFVLTIVGVSAGWTMIVAGLVLLPAGVAIVIAERKIDRMDAEVSAFFRSLGGTATSRGTTLTDALLHMETDAFPALETDVEQLRLRLNAFGKPDLCWTIFGKECGSKLIDQAVGIFHGAISLGGDPEKTGIMASLFAMKTAMLRAKRRGLSDTFSWLTITMHTVLVGLMFFLLEVINQFVLQLETAMVELEGSEEALQSLALDTFTFGRGHLDFLQQITIGMVIILVLINGFAVVASEGSHVLKIVFYAAILLVLSGVCYLVAPSGVALIM